MYKSALLYSCNHLGSCALIVHKNLTLAVHVFQGGCVFFFAPAELRPVHEARATSTSDPVQVTAYSQICLALYMPLHLSMVISHKEEGELR